MTVIELLTDLAELDPKADVYFVRNAEDQLIYLVSQLPNNTTKVCRTLPTAIHKTEIKESK